MSTPTPKNAAEERAARLKAALKANLARRKAQNRARSAPRGQDAPDTEHHADEKDR